MVNPTLKKIYYRVLRVPMRISGMAYRRYRAPRDGTARVQLGSGKRGYLACWINLDANFITARPDVWANLKDPLPFRDESLDVVYSYHVIEHLADDSLQEHFRDVHRCLKPGGLYRIGAPDAEQAMRRFLADDSGWFPDWPDNRSSSGGRLNNFLLFRGEHTSLITFSWLSELADAAGFRQIVRTTPGAQTTRPDLVTTDLLTQEAQCAHSRPIHTLTVEMVK